MTLLRAVLLGFLCFMSSLASTDFSSSTTSTNSTAAKLNITTPTLTITSTTEATESTVLPSIATEEAIIVTTPIPPLADFEDEFHTLIPRNDDHLPFQIDDLFERTFLMMQIAIFVLVKLSVGFFVLTPIYSKLTSPDFDDKNPTFHGIVEASPTVQEPAPAPPVDSEEIREEDEARPSRERTTEAHKISRVSHCEPKSRNSSQVSKTSQASNASKVSQAVSRESQSQLQESQGQVSEGGQVGEGGQVSENQLPDTSGIEGTSMAGGTTQRGFSINGYIVEDGNTTLR